MVFQAFFCIYILFVYFYVWFLLNGGPSIWSLCFSCFSGPSSPSLSPLTLSPQALLAFDRSPLVGFSKKISQIAEITDSMLFLECHPQTFCPRTFLLGYFCPLCNQCPPQRKLLLHQIEFGQLRCWVSPTKKFSHLESGQSTPRPGNFPKLEENCKMGHTTSL